MPAYTIAIDDGSSVSYHKNINATCVENLLEDRFSGWELDLPKPIDEIEVKAKILFSNIFKLNYLSDELYSEFSLQL